MNKETILVVEDNLLNMKLVRNLLHLEGYQVLEAGDGEQGIGLAREHRPDLILMDIQLPGMDGLTATRQIKGDTALKHIPVVALTSYAMQGDEERAREAHCDGYIAKPINTRTFLDQIKGFWDKDNNPAPPLPLMGPIKHKNKILIVDDEPLNIKLLEAKLPREKYEVLKALSGKQAIEIAGAESPDLILLDIMMPEMNGFEVTRWLKKNPETERIPIIQVTALDGSEDKVMGLEAGADEFLNKPVNTAELLARINSLLRLKQYQEQLVLRTRSDESFCLTFPGRESAAPKTLPKILLVDDDQRESFLIQTFLEGGAYQLELARSAEEALALVQNEKIDLVLLDILLPGMNGFDLCQHLKDKVLTKDIQVVLITCLQDLENKIRGMELGADDYLIKPINRRELAARINVLLKKKETLDKLRNDFETALNSATTDGLTGAFNQAYLKRYLELELKRAFRQRYPVSLILIDFDNFKLLNDTLGHLAGDLVLKEFSQAIKENIREIDLAARYGGDEFAIALPYADQEEALFIAERIQRAVASYPFSSNASNLLETVRISMGIAVYPAHANTPEELIRNSDDALYQAKKQGKNRMVLYGRGQSEAKTPSI
ncbi:MAG: response regulator [Deltaproteobacteria bacterium]|nr:response regulator [Deltaproteobacteria bacterium]